MGINQSVELGENDVGDPGLALIELGAVRPAKNQIK